jgi:hypothetical protein
LRLSGAKEAQALERFWDYKRYAAECVSLARLLPDPERRAKLLAMAKAWLRLAQLAEKNSQNDVVYETPMEGQRPPRPSRPEGEARSSA